MNKKLKKYIVSGLVAVSFTSFILPSTFNTQVFATESSFLMDKVKIDEFISFLKKTDSYELLEQFLTLDDSTKMIFIDKFYKQEYDIEESYSENDSSNVSSFRSANVIRNVSWTSRHTIAGISVLEATATARYTVNGSRIVSLERYDAYISKNWLPLINVKRVSLDGYISHYNTVVVKAAFAVDFGISFDGNNYGVTKTIRRIEFGADNSGYVMGNLTFG